MKFDGLIDGVIYDRYSFPCITNIELNSVSYNVHGGSQFSNDIPACRVIDIFSKRLGSYKEYPFSKHIYIT